MISRERKHVIIAMHNATSHWQANISLFYVWCYLLYLVHIGIFLIAMMERFSMITIMSYHHCVSNICLFVCLFVFSSIYANSTSPACYMSLTDLNWYPEKKTRSFLIFYQPFKIGQTIKKCAKSKALNNQSL